MAKGKNVSIYVNIVVSSNVIAPTNIFFLTDGKHNAV